MHRTSATYFREERKRLAERLGDVEKERSALRERLLGLNREEALLRDLIADLDLHVPIDVDT